MSASNPVDSLDKFLDGIVLSCVRWVKRVYRAATTPEPSPAQHSREHYDDLADWAFGHGVHERIDQSVRVAVGAVADWSLSHADHVSSKVVVDQLKFLLSQAPMIDAPVDLFNAGRAVTKYAFVHPKTFEKFTKNAYAPKGSAPYIQIRPSSTKWVITTLMPENQVIYTPNPMPGIEKNLAR